MEALLLEAFKSGKPLELIKNVVFFIVAWHMVKKEIKIHFKIVEDNLSELNSTIKATALALTGRIDNLEIEVEKLKIRE